MRPNIDGRTGGDQVLSEFAVRPKVNSNVPPPPAHKLYILSSTIVRIRNYLSFWSRSHIHFKEIHTYT